MGGFGSGRPSGSGRDKVEYSRSIDVNRLHKAGCLTPGWTRGWQWTQDGEKVASINLRAEPDRLHLSYRVRIAGGEWESIEEPVRIVRAPCPFDGARPYFICPGVVNGITCGRRVAKLHGPGRYFLCRHCYRLAPSTVRVRISSAPASSTASPAGGASPSCTARGAISCAGTVIASPMPARAKTGGTGPCAAPTRSSNAWAVIPAWPRPSRKSPRACGGELTSACATNVSTLRCVPTRPLRSMPNECSPTSTTENPQGDSDADRTQNHPAAGDCFHYRHPIPLQSAGGRGSVTGDPLPPR